MSVEAIMNEVQTLSRDEQLELQHRLDEHLSGPKVEPELSDEVREMLDRRIAFSRENPGSGLSWESVLEEARRRRKK